MAGHLDVALAALANAHDALHAGSGGTIEAERQLVDAQRTTQAVTAHCDTALTRVQLAVSGDAAAIPAVMRGAQQAVLTAQAVHAAGEAVLALRESIHAALQAVDAETARLQTG